MALSSTQARNYAIAISNKYTDTSIEGTTGPLAGKNCQILSTENIEISGKTGKRITFSWYKDDETVARTTTVDIMDGDTGPQGEQGEAGEKGDTGEAGFSPEIIVVENTANVYKLQITTEEGSFITPNLRGGGAGGVDVSVSGDNLVFTYN